MASQKRTLDEIANQACNNRRQVLRQLSNLDFQVEFKNKHQRDFYESIKSNDITFCEGPAGAGKTFIASYFALQALGNKESSYDGIVIAKPLVEAGGEKIGFLPGDVEEKTEPFMMSYYYNMEMLIGYQRLKVLRQDKIINVIPMAYMRGLTFSNKIVILDETQNASQEQMKMFITRLGEGSKYIIMGDSSQTDLRGVNGLKDSIHRFKEIPGVGICRFDKYDIVRHKLISILLSRYGDGELY